MTRAIYATLVGLLGAMLVHLSIVLALPYVSQNTPWTRLAETAELNRATVLAGTNQPDVAVPAADGLDPYFVAAACRYDLSTGALAVTTQGGLPLWTVAVSNSLGTTFFSANDRIVAGDRLELVIVDAGQERFLRQSVPAQVQNAIVVPASDIAGYVVVRGFVPNASWALQGEAFTASLTCNPIAF